MTDKTGLEKAAAVVGSKWKLGKALGLSKAAIYFWKEIPVKHLAAIEKLTGVPREELRPDIFKR